MQLLVSLVMAASGGAEPGSELSVIREPETIRVEAGDRVVLRYRYEGVPYKPCVDWLATPAGINILRDAPHDHLHHHALMYAVNIDGVNFWEERNKPGTQRHTGFADKAQIVETLDWQEAGGKVLANEQRTIELAGSAPDDVTLLTWRARLAVPPGNESATLTGAHYHGLGMRFVESMDSNGTFRNADDAESEVVRGTERLTPSRWCAYTAEADDKPVTVAMFGHPDNPRGPALWFTMTSPFAYLSATLNLHREPLEVTRDKPLALCYGVALWDGDVDTKRIEDMYKEWLEGEE